MKRVKCGNDFDNCANIVKFYRSKLQIFDLIIDLIMIKLYFFLTKDGTTIIYSSFCYGQVKNNKECKEDIGFKDGQTCKITCTNDFCNPIVNEDLESPYKVIPNYELLEISSTVKSPSQNYSERKNSSFLKCYSINLIIITLLINFLYHKIRI